MDQIVTADIEAYDPASLGPRVLRYATRGYTTGVTPTAEPTLDSRITFSRGSTATRFNMSGVLETVAANVPRFDYDPSTLAALGLLIEESRTNSIRNNTMQGAAAGTPGTLPTNWGAFTSLTGLTRTLAVGTENGIAYLDIRLNGTPSASGDYQIFPEAGTQVAATSGQTWTQSSYYKLQAGSMAGISDFQIAVIESNVSGGFLAGTFTTQPAPSAATVRGAVTRTLNNASTAFVTPGYRLALTGVAIDITLRIGLPQLEQGVGATSPIPTSTVAVTRNADVATITTLTPWFNATAGTIYTESQQRASTTPVLFPRIVAIDDGSTNNALLHLWRTDTSRLFANGVVGGAGQYDLGANGVTQTDVARMASAFAANDFAMSQNGGAVVTDTAGTVPSGLTTLRLGRSSGTDYLNGWIRRVVFFPTRLTNAQLQSLSSGQSIPAGARLDLNFLGNAHQHYEGRIQQPGNIERTIFGARRTTGRTQIGFGAMTLVNNDGGLDALLDYSFAGRPVSIRLGTISPATGQPTWSTVLRGTMEQAELSWQRVTMRVRDRLLDLAKPIQQTRYAGNNALPNGLEGLAQDLKGKPKPIVFGRVWNLAPALVNTDRRIYQIHSGSALQSLGEVYDRGVPLGNGGGYASQADMEANVPAAGQYRLWNDATAGAFIRLGSAPAGLVTVDAIRGAAVANRTVGQLFQQILLAAGIPQSDINAADITALDAAVGYECGVYAGFKNDVTPLELLDELCSSVGAWYGADALGQFRIGRVVLPTSGSVATITATDVTRIERVASRDPGVGVPAWKVKVGYRKIEEVQGDLGTAVSDLRRAFFTEQYRRVEASDAAVKDANALSPEIEFLTVLSNEADAAAEASRLLTLYKTRRDLYEVTVRVDASTAAVLDLGKAVTLQLPRFGLSAGKLFLIIGITTNLRGYHFDLTLWG